MKKFFIFIIFAGFIFSGCNLSGKRILAKRIQKMEESSGNPVTIEQINDAIKKYDKEAKEVQQKYGKIGIWYKILGTRYIDKKMYGEAMQCFQKALEYYPDNPNLYYYVGVCAGYLSHSALDFDATGNKEKRYNYLKLAEDSYLQALRIDDRYTNVLYGLGILYVFELDESEKAIPHLQKYLSIETRSIDGMFVLAHAYYMNYEFDKAVELYDKIIATSKSAEKRAEAENNKKIALDASYANY